MITSLRDRAAARFESWLEKRLPRQPSVWLNRNRIFVLPSKAGLAFLLVLILLWLVSVNYENNLVFAFAALLAAMMVVSIFHSYANLAGLRLRVPDAASTFAGERARVDVELHQGGSRHRDDIWLHFPDSLPQRATLHNGESTAVVSLYVPARRRGRLHTGRLTVESFYPLGLIRVWTHVLLDNGGLVYPAPVPDSMTAAGGEEAEEGGRDESGTEDFLGLSRYRRGEPLNRIAWKQLARGQGLHTKHFADPQGSSEWIDWNAFPGMDREARLSRLCHCVLEAAAGDGFYGLVLPGEQSELGRGTAHRDRLLAMLALFEWQPDG